MCKISNKIKFCSCVGENSDVQDLNHYWILNRYNKTKKTFYFGEIVIPYSRNKDNFKENQTTLLNALVEKSTFDKAMYFKEKDVLQVYLHNHSKNHKDTLKLKFQHKSGRWEPLLNDEDLFYLLNHFDKTDSGKIEELD